MSPVHGLFAVLSVAQRTGGPADGRGDDVDEHIASHSADAFESGLEFVTLLRIRLVHRPLGEYRQDPVGN